MPKSKGNKLPPFVAMTWEVLNSKAFRSLNFSSGKALPFFLGKVKSNYRDSQRYLISFSFSYKEAGRYGFAPATFSNVIRELVQKGFLDPVDKGGLRGDGKSYNLFRLSQRWLDYGSAEFKEIDWKCFIPKTRSKATSNSEKYSFIKRNKKCVENKVISEFEVVEVF
jgi:hypothetical protein